MFKKKISKGFIFGLLIGIVVAVVALYSYDQYLRKSKIERETEKIEKQTQKEIDKAKKLFE